MSLIALNGEKLYYSFVSGAREVIKNRRILNDINIFPVADSDTGNNMASTMHSIIEETRVNPSAKHTLNSIAEAALTGARGNSGIIMAQYINGMFESLEEDEEITLHGFATTVKKAVPHAYRAISNPVEGTIITVIRDWADAVYSNKDNAKNFHELLMKPLEAAMISLKETTAKMKVLERSRLVDSGAKGFVYFVQGLTEYMKEGRLSEEPLEKDEIALEMHRHNEGSITFRYCTEALIVKKSENLDLDFIRSRLDEMGDSVIVAGNISKSRIHVHTNRPEDVMNFLRNNAEITQQKAEDMLRQHQIINEKKHSIALVTDSIADLPKEFMDNNQIHLVPLNLVLENSSYLDKVTMTPEIFYTMLDDLEEYPTSSQPSIKLVENLLAMLLESYDEILAVTVAKKQSGTHSVFVKAAEKLSIGGKRIEIVDSRQNSGAQGLMVMKAAEMIESGGSLDDIVKKLNVLAYNTKILVSVNTLKYMVRSGRISKLTGTLGKLINLKPVVSLDKEGKGIIQAKAFTLKSNTRIIMDILMKENKKNKITRYALVHANDQVRAEEFKRMCKKILHMEPEYMMNISTIVGMNAGIGSVAVAYMCEEEI